MRERGSDSRAEVVGSGRASEPKSRPCATLFRRLSTKQRSYVSRRLSPQTHAHTLTPAAHAPSPHPCLAPDGENHEEKKVREMRGPARSIAFFFFCLTTRHPPSSSPGPRPRRRRHRGPGPGRHARPPALDTPQWWRQWRQPQTSHPGLHQKLRPSGRPGTWWCWLVGGGRERHAAAVRPAQPGRGGCCGWPEDRRQQVSWPRRPAGRLVAAATRQERQHHQRPALVVLCDHPTPSPASPPAPPAAPGRGPVQRAGPVPGCLGGGHGRGDVRGGAPVPVSVF